MNIDSVNIDTDDKDDYMNLQATWTRKPERDERNELVERSEDVVIVSVNAGMAYFVRKNGNLRCDNIDRFYIKGSSLGEIFRQEVV